MDNNVEVGKDGRKDKDGRRANLWDYQVETAGLQSGSAGNDSEGHFCESRLDDGASRSLHDKHQGNSKERISFIEIR